jgi:hypothetical protein
MSAAPGGRSSDQSAARLAAMITSRMLTSIQGEGERLRGRGVWRSSFLSTAVSAALISRERSVFESWFMVWAMFWMFRA